MIDAKDIMVGNWFQHNANWCFRSPEDVKPFLFQWEERDWYALGECTMSLDDVSPIPLSPDILEKAGFKYMGYGYKNLDHWRFFVSYHQGFHVCCEPEHTVPLCKCEHVHQLQNLYYSLTNQELNIHL